MLTNNGPRMKLGYDNREFSSFFFCFLPIFDRERSFSIFLKQICSLTVNESSFLGDPSVPSFESKDGNSYPGSRFMADELRFWLKRLAERPDMMYVRALVWPVVQG